MHQHRVTGVWPAAAGTSAMIEDPARRRLLGDQEISAVVTDSLGRFRLPGAPDGTLQLGVRALGFQAVSVLVDHTPLRNDGPRIVMPRLTTLRAVRVTAPRSFEGFELIVVKRSRRFPARYT